jgi:addiction module RelB/DinJ family antitoxin
MPKTFENPLVRVRIEPKRKRSVEKILEKMGMSPSQAINMLYAQIELKHGLPFPVVAGLIHGLREVARAERLAALERSAGILSDEEGAALERVIEEGCGKIDARDW